MNWLEETIKQDVNDLHSDDIYKRDYAISTASITHIPCIYYDGLSEDECIFIQEQVAEALKLSKEEIYKEVAITFSLNDLQNLYTVKGDYSSIPLLEDPNTKALIKSLNKKGDIIVVNIHNHPNNSIFSLNDLYIFTKTPSIKLMNIVNTKGEVSFLLRSKDVKDLNKYMDIQVHKVVPDYKKRFNDWEKNNNSSQEFKLSDILNKNEIAKIVKNSLYEIKNFGVYHNNFIGEREAKTMVFNPIELSEEPIQFVESSNYNPNALNIGEYYENGEDGYEWFNEQDHTDEQD